MANQFYDKARVRNADGAFDWDGDDMRIAAVSSGYTPNIANDEFASVLGTNILGTPMTIPARTIATGGWLMAGLTSYAGVLSGDTVTGWAIYQWSGSLAASPLVAFMDENDDGSPISRAGDGTNIPVQWHATQGIGRW